ncbi:MAG: HAD family phosphatase [Eggerthellaceae bacterium]
MTWANDTIKGVLLDCDGTLLDTMPLWHAMERTLAKRAGIEFTEKLSEMLNANTLTQTVTFFHEEHGVGSTSAVLFEECSAALRNAYRTRVKPKPGALDFIESLNKAQVPVAIVSSSPCIFLEAGLEHTGIMPYITLVCSAEDEGRTKRDPGYLIECARRLNVDLENACLIDDSAYALAAARAAGMRTLGVYDSEIAGTMHDLRQVSDIALHTLTELNIDCFLGRKTDDFE